MITLPVLGLAFARIFPTFASLICDSLTRQTMLGKDDSDLRTLAERARHAQFGADAFCPFTHTDHAKSLTRILPSIIRAHTIVVHSKLNLVHFEYEVRPDLRCLSVP